MLSKPRLPPYYLLSICLLLGILNHSISAVSFLEWFHGQDSHSSDAKSSNLSTLADLSQLRVRDLKRRLARQHGYGADEIAKMLDKKELIHTLLYEEHKLFQKGEERRHRIMWKRRILVALACVVVVMFRDLWIHLYELISVNIVVYTDKKVYEVSRCREFNSWKGMIGILLMVVLDCLQAWLTLSVLLSWVMTSSYFFPMPVISIKPAQLLATMAGSGNSGGPLANYGINIGPMIITWIFRYGHGLIENWTGKKLSESYAQRRKEEKEIAKQKRSQKGRADSKRRREAYPMPKDSEQRNINEDHRNRNHSRESTVEDNNYDNGEINPHCPLEEHNEMNQLD